MTAFRLRYGAEDVDLQQREQSFRGYFSLETLTLRHRLFEGGWSAPVRRELFQRGDAVGVLPWDPETDELVLIEQFRVGALRDGHSPWMLELVAGIVEVGESDSEVVHREAEEEAGCRLGRLESIATFCNDHGVSLKLEEMDEEEPEKEYDPDEEQSRPGSDDYPYRYDNDEDDDDDHIDDEHVEDLYEKYAE